MPMNPIKHLRRLLVIAVLSLLLAACSGSGDSGDEIIDTTGARATCSITDQKAWLGGYMDDWYFWYQLSQHPDPAPYTSVGDYFDALLYTGTSANFPPDRWSFTETTESFNRFFDDGQMLGYGISVAGVEVQGQPDQPLYVRYVEQLSPAAKSGVVRGDQVISINGRSAADIITATDYTALTTENVGDTISLVLRNGNTDRMVTVRADVFDLSPVPNATVMISPLGHKLGYVVVKDMINQVQAPLETAFAQFKTAGVSEIVLDLRYNGGGLISVGDLVASYVAGTRGDGHTYASLLFNDKRAADYNQSFVFSSGLVSAASVGRVFVLTGPRTCSASEQVINALRGIGVDVVSVGDTSCGKPVGFLPTSACGTIYNAVNFESVNELNQGRYFNGFAPTCPVAEDFTAPMGSAGDRLLVAAAYFVDNGTCPAQKRLLWQPSLREDRRRMSTEPGERQGMIGR